MNHDNAFVKAATDATQEHNKQQQAGGSTPTGPPHCYAWVNMLELLVTDNMGLGEEGKHIIQKFCQEHASLEAMGQLCTYVA